MPTLFSRIASGELPCHKIAENDTFLAFLDISPLALGHTLVIPKVEEDYIFDLPPQVLAGLLPFAAPVARAIARVVPCRRIGFAVIGLEVPHAHVHLVPLQSVADINFERPKMSVPDAELAALAAKIREAL